MTGHCNVICVATGTMLNQLECENILGEPYNSLCANVDSDLYWYCKKCKSCATKIMLGITAIQREQKKMAEELSILQGQVAKRNVTENK